MCNKTGLGEKRITNHQHWDGRKGTEEGEEEREKRWIVHRVST